MKRLKVLYISHSLPPEDEPIRNIGGMQNVSLQLMQALEGSAQVELKSIVQRVPWREIRYSTLFFLFRLLHRIPRAVREFQPDIILFTSMVTAGVAPFLGGRLRVPLVAINHGQDVTLPVWLYQKYLPIVFRRLNGVISVSEATRQASILRGMDPKKGVVLPNGLDREKTDHLPSKEEARSELQRLFGVGAAGVKSLLLTVGRLVERKGHVWFIREVLPKLNSSVDYLIVGDGPEKEAIRREIETTGQQDKVFLAGRQPESVLLQSYAAADLFVMPNIPVEGDLEGFGIVLLEANHSGLPAVASDIDGIRDVIKPGVNGFLVPHKRPAIFAEKVDQVLNNDLENLSNSSKRFVLEQFNWERVVGQYVDVLKKMIRQ